MDRKLLKEKIEWLKGELEQLLDALKLLERHGHSGSYAWDVLEEESNELSDKIEDLEEKLIEKDEED